MENGKVEVPQKEYFHYNHTDSCSFSRWTSREAYAFMYARPWQIVVDFYSKLVNGETTLDGLFGSETRHIFKDTVMEPSEKSEVVITPSQERTGRWARANFKIVLSYHGGSFDGWQKQPALSTVQGIVEQSLGKFVDGKKAARLTDKGLPLEGTVVVAGRTDKGVTGFQQVCSFYAAVSNTGRTAYIDEVDKKQLAIQAGLLTSTIKFVGKWTHLVPDFVGRQRIHCLVIFGELQRSEELSKSFNTWRTDVKPEDIEDAISNTTPGKLTVISVSQVSRTFHPNFSAKWRRYLYIFPLNDIEDWEEKGWNTEDAKNICYNKNNGDERNNIDDFISEQSLKSSADNDKDDLESKKKPTMFKVTKVNKLLQQLEGKLLSYKMFARDTKPSRNIGPPTECFLFHARATKVTLFCDAKNGEKTEAMCVELVANRFLRKMVRVLVATSIREAAAGAEDDALIKLMDATCRRATAPPAPPDGLCLVNVGYEEFDSRTCLIY